MSYFNAHNHTHYSNIRLLDCICKPEALIDKAIELGLSGIAITDHECIGGWIKINQYAQKIKEKHPDFKIGLGNEIYLTDTRDKGQKYYHFLLIAKDAIGAEAIQTASSIAWYNLYEDRRMERVPILKKELTLVMKKYKGHVIGTSACLGGELSSLVNEMIQARRQEDSDTASAAYERIVSFIQYCLDTFGDDFYIECAPSDKEPQVSVNKKLYEISKIYNIPLIAATDTHYLMKEDRYVHKAYLNSKGGEREVDAFYEFARLIDEKEYRELLRVSFEPETIDDIIANTHKIQDKLEEYSLHRNQQVPEEEVINYPKKPRESLKLEAYPTLAALLVSDNIQERYWINQCIEAMHEKDVFNEIYLSRLEEEARIKKIVGEKLGTCMYAYPNTLQHYIDLFWDCGSTVGAGRGSACSGLNHYLLGITQLDPIQWGLPFWR